MAVSIDQSIIRLTPQQRQALEVLHGGTQTTRQLADSMLPGEPYMTYDRAHALLARLQRRGLVGRSRVAGRWIWSITPTGQEALA